MPRTHRIAFMLQLEWPYKRHAGILNGALSYAHEQGWETIVDEYADDSLPANSAQSSSLPYDGVIARASKKLVKRASVNAVPVVNVWFNSAVRDSLPGVFPDWRAIGRLRVEHLLSRGFRRFAALNNVDDYAQKVELEAFLGRLNELGYPCIRETTSLDAAESLAKWRKNERNIESLIEKLQPPVGVFVGSDDEGRIVAQKCRNRGWRVPEDVSIITGVNEETFCERLRPTLTSVEVGYERVGYEAARMLDALMDSKERKEVAVSEPNHVLLPPTGLVLRESTDFMAVDDKTIAEALEYISTNCHRHIGPSDVAKAISIETRTLQRRFRKHLELPIVDVIRRVRIERAKRELVQSNQSMAEIARKVGFGDATRMYEVFRREMNVAPSEYRKERTVQRRS